MKKIASLIVMWVLCCAGAFSQATEFADKLIQIGTVQAEMVPGQWYFLHTPRNLNHVASAFGLPGDMVQSAGGVVYDKGPGNGYVSVTTTSVLDVLTADGVSANANMDKLVRFHAVEGEEGAYQIEFGTGNWMSDSPNSGTVTKNQYIEGEAGKYNFYLVKNADGNPNTAGRFGWNKYNMADRVDNNGAGYWVSFWSSGETTVGGDNWEDNEGIAGNKIWQIYDVVVLGEEDKSETALMYLIEEYNAITEREDYMYVDNLREGINVGDSYGNYRPEDVDAFLALHDQVEDAIIRIDSGEDITDIFPAIADIVALRLAYVAADERIQANKIPLAASDIVPGYYTINSMNYFYVTKNDTVYYTQEECNQLNDENGYVEGDEGFLTTNSVKEVASSQVPAPTKALAAQDYQGAGWLAWASLQQKCDFLWKIEAVEGRPTEYRLINMYKNQTFRNIPQSQNVQMVDDDSATVVFDYMGVKEIPVTAEVTEAVEKTAYAIRNAGTTEGGMRYIHCGGHSNGAGTGAWIVGWSSGANASQWYLNPIDDATAQAWMESDELKYRQMITEANTIISTVPAQFEIARDVVTTIHENDSVVVDVSQFSSPWTESSEGSLEALLDGNPQTFWHSTWSSGNAGVHQHYLQVAANEPLEGLYSAILYRRSMNGSLVSNDNPTKLAVRGYDTDDESLTFEDGEDLGVLNFPLGTVNEPVNATTLFDGKGHTYFRFYWEESNGSFQRGYWHVGEFNIFKATASTYHADGTTQYQAREAIITRLQAAMDAWNAGEYTEETAEKYADPAFQAAYTELIAASEAWEAVYVDPTALREAIATAPAENLFVVGANPGEFKEGTVTPATTVNAANDYDKSGAYTPAQSEQLILDIANAAELTFDAANKVETGKWYRIKYPTEEMYDTYGWDKTGAAEVVDEATGLVRYPKLFGKTLASGKSITEYVPSTNDYGEDDTLTIYQTATVETVYDGNNLVFFDDDQLADISEGEDLFRFIEATDSSYIVQHKASGLFVNAPGTAASYVTLSAAPTYFQVSAIGAGANIISMTNIFGEKPSAHVNIHAQRANNMLVCWQSDNLGSNSALLIEEAEVVTDEPATTYQKKMWPGNVYAVTYPVDVTIGEGATAYSAELATAEDTNPVVLKAIEADTIKAGTPFVLIADFEGEYITPDDRLSQIASDLLAQNGQYGLVEKQMANEMLNEEYFVVSMSHGMKVDTVATSLGNLVGTFRNVTVEAGKGLVAKDNGFVHTASNKTVNAFGAYVAYDFDVATVYLKVMEEIQGFYESVSAQDEGAFIDNLREGVNVGTSNGNYRQEDVDAFLTLWNRLEMVIGNEEAMKELWPDVATLTAFKNELKAAYEALAENRIVVNTLYITVDVPGSMGDSILSKVENFADVQSIKISGTLNSDDITTIQSRLTNLTEIDLTDVNMTALPNEFFYQRSKLTTVKLPKNLTTIGNYAFYRCEGLKSIDFPATLTTIGDYAFYDCKSLQQVILPEGLTTLGDYAFYSCDNNKYLKLPSTLKTINYGAFYDNYNLVEIDFAEGLTHISSNAFNSCRSLETLICPSTLYYIGNNAFAYNSSLDSIAFNEGLYQIADNAFYDCDALTEVTLPSSLVLANASPFDYCNNLRKVTCLSIEPPYMTDQIPLYCDMAGRELYVPALSINAYKQATGWDKFQTILPIDYLPENITVLGNLKLTLPETMPAEYKPNVSIISDTKGSSYWQYGSLTVNGAGTLSMSQFSIVWDPNCQYDYYYNSDRNQNYGSLVNNSHLRADSVSVNMVIRNDYWNFVSFPFDVNMSDIQATHEGTTNWVVRKYDAEKRAAGETGSTWVKLTNDDVLNAGEGYIIQSSRYIGTSWQPNSAFRFNAIDNANKNNMFTANDVSVTLAEHESEFAHNRGWNFIGNPYPCYYDTRFMDFEAPITVWDLRNNTYAAYSTVDDSYILLPGESFFVQRPLDNGTLTFSKDGRQTNRTARTIEEAAARTNAESKASRYVLNFTLSDGENTDRTRVVINNGASLDYESNRDAAKFMSTDPTVPQFYTVHNGINYAINERPMANGVIDVAVVTPTDGLYTITLQNEIDGCNVVLEDKLLGNFTPMTAGTEYTFMSNAADNTKRFSIHIEGTTTGIDDTLTGVTDSSSSDVYTITGIKTSTPINKGVYIQNGKKVIFK